MSQTPRPVAPNTRRPARRTHDATRTLTLSSALLRASVLFSLLLLASSYCLAQTAAQPTPTPNARRAPAGSIKGRVVGEDGQPLAHVSLYLLNRSWGTRSRQPGPASSDEDGKFSFDDLDHGLYSIRVHLPGYTADAGAGEQPATADYRVGDDVTLRLFKGGVITGTVTTADGEPLVGVTVRVTRLRTIDDRPATQPDFWFGNDNPTDDRGVYRIYGLPAGVYLVSAGGGHRWNWMPPTPYDSDVPTYFRSATIDTAEEVTVRSGQEVGGVDLRYRGERGHTVSGTLAMPPTKGIDTTLNVSLAHAVTGMNVGSVVSLSTEGAHSFALDGVPDGEYELRAFRYKAEGEGEASEPLRVNVRGADVTGLRLVLAAFGSIGGDLTMEPLREPAGECKTATRRALMPQEVLVSAQREERAKSLDPRRPAAPERRESSPDQAGAFVLRTLEAGRYYVDARVADEGWYVRDIQLPAPNTSSTAAPSSAAKPPAPNPAAGTATSNTTVKASRRALDLKPAQQLTGLRVAIAEGAASLSGRLAPRAEGATLPPTARLRVHLVPAEREQADNALRYYETTPAPDGSFSFKQLAPGRYFILAEEADASPTRPAAWDATARARLRREAETADAPVELAPCQRRTDTPARLQP